MPRLNLHFLGSPQVDLDGEPISIQRRKGLALLAYVALADHPQRRELLATLLWPESDQSRARGSLRREISHLNQLLGDGWLAVDRENISLQPDAAIRVDVTDFLTLANQSNMQALIQAANLYRGDLLTGFTLSDAPDFDEWHFFQSEALRQQATRILDQLADECGRQTDHSQAIGYARRRLSLDPLHEEAHRRLMHFYAQAGQQAAALRQFDTCVRILDEELGVPPDKETEELAAAIRSRRIPESDSIQTPAVTHQVPKAATVEGSPPESRPEPEEQIRPVAVLTVGLTASAQALWDHQPDQAYAQIGQLQEICDRVLEQYGVGLEHLLEDSLLAIFGAPQAHEDDADRALVAGREIQNRAQEAGLPLSVGISSGFVYYAHGRATGRPVTLATLLQAQAGEGDVWVDATIYRHTRLAYRYEPRTLILRGAPQPVTAHRLLRPRRRATKTRGLEGMQAHLIGRDRELNSLRDALNQTLTGSGQIVTLVGEAGLGKSRLVQELRQLAEEVNDSGGKLPADVPMAAPFAHASRITDPTPPPLWLEGRCQEMTQISAYWPFVDILRSLLVQESDDDSLSRAQQLTRLVQRLGDANELPQEQQDDLGALLGRLLALRFHNAWDDRFAQVSPDQVQFHTARALTQLFQFLAWRQPLILVLEDLHWVDDLTLDLIVRLMDVLDDSSLLLLCVYRPQASLRCLHLPELAARKAPHRLTEVRLRELSPEQSRQMVSELLHLESLPDNVRARILSRSQGNPFFIEEVIHSLIESGLLYHEERRWLAQTEIPSELVPESVQSVVLSRFDRLSVDGRSFLQAAAVVGRLFSQPVVERMLPSSADVSHLLADLEDEGQIYLEQSLPEPIYSFRHVLARDAVYAILPGSRRRELHGRAGVALEAHYAAALTEQYEQLAYHYDQSDYAQKAVDYLLKAGEKARQDWLNDQAVTHFQRALKRLDELPRSPSNREYRFAALMGLGRIYAIVSDHEPAEKHLREAIRLGREIAAPKSQLIRLHVWLGDMLLNWNRQGQAALQVGLDGLALLDSTAQATERAMLNGVLVWAYWMLGNREEYLRIGLESADLVADLPYMEELRPIFGAVRDTLLESGQFEKAIAWGESYRRRAQESRDLRGMGESLWAQAGTQLFFTSKPRQEIVDLVRQAQRHFTQAGDTMRANWMLNQEGVDRLTSGKLAEAEQKLAAAVEVSASDPVNLMDALTNLGTVYLNQRRPETARELFLRALTVCRDFNLHLAEAAAGVGFSYLAENEMGSAADYFRRSLASLSESGLNPPLSRHSFGAAYLFPGVLWGLELALNDTEKYYAAVSSILTGTLRQDLPGDFCWQLVPVTPKAIRLTDPTESSPQQHLSDWEWVDPVGDSTYALGDNIEIWVPPMRNLFWHQTAPQLLRPVSGDFVVQVTVGSAQSDRPVLGGLILWNQDGTYLSLNQGIFAPDTVDVTRSENGQGVTMGLGNLFNIHIYLRMECFDGHVRCLCSQDGKEWLQVGPSDLRVDAPQRIGLWACGFLPRMTYWGTYPDGSAIRFTGFQLWQ